MRVTHGQAVVQEARATGAKRLKWQVLEWNEPAFNFYRKFDTKFDAEWVNAVMEI